MSFNEFSREALKELLVTPQQLRRAGSASGKLRVHASECGHGVVADAVARVVVPGIAAVLHVGDALSFKVCVYLLARHAQDGPYHAPAPRRDAAKASQPRAAREIEQHGFGVVISRVRSCDGVRSQRIRRLLEEFVPQPARSVLGAEAVFTGKGRDIAAAEICLHTEPGAEGAHEVLIPVGFGPAQAVIIMCGPDLQAEALPQLAETTEQIYGVRAARDRAEHAPVLGQQRGIKAVNHRHAACPRPRRRCTPAATSCLWCPSDRGGS